MIPTAGFSAAQTIGWCLASLLVSMLFTGLALVYARRRNLLDLPGQRRSHTQPTPRGGGIGICVSVVAGSIALGLVIGDVPVRLIVAIVLVAAIGWVDDHRPLPAVSRLLVQLIASVIFLWNVFAGADSAFEWFASFALLFVCVWSINLHNFMDGIDGILATQGIFVLAALSILCMVGDDQVSAIRIGMWSAAVAGFLPFNFPRARIFMGDVGSGTVGLLIAIAAIWQFAAPGVAAASGLIAVSAFLTDATCTLLSRMSGGRRWYNAHREHLYQWMTRAGMSHAQVVGWYSAWNVLVVLPVIWLINSRFSKEQWLIEALIYTVSATLWICGKRWCLYKVKSSSNLSHA